MAHFSSHHVVEGLQARVHEVETKLRHLALQADQRLDHFGESASARMRNFPDWGRRSIRLSLCMLFWGLLGHAGVLGSGLYGSELKQSCNWAAITCIVVTAPLIGQVAEVSVFRVVGTIAGGMLGFLIWELSKITINAYWAGLIVVLLSPAMITFTTHLAAKHNAEQLTRFVQLTYVIVGYGAAAKEGKSAAVLAALRVSGIIGGGMLSLLLAVIVLPRAASIESCRELKKSLKGLVDLNKAVWAAASMQLPQEPKPRKKGVLAHLGVMSAIGQRFFSVSSSDTNRGMRGAGGSHMDLAAVSMTMHNITKSASAKREDEVEKLFHTVFTSLSKVETMLAQCKGEVFVGAPFGKYLFLPSFLPAQLYGYKFKTPGKWHLPEEDVALMITIARRLARLLWTLLLDFEDGFDTTMQAVLAQYYPTALMSELALYTHKALLDLHNAFPNRTYIEVDNLLNLGQIIECLIQISDTRNRSLGVQRKKRSRPGFSSTMSAQRSTSGPLHTTLDPSLFNTGRQSRTSASVPAADVAVGMAGATGAAPPAAPTAVFASRTLSSQPGQLSYIELPPRQLLKAVEQGQGGLQMSASMRRASEANSPLRRSISIQRHGPLPTHPSTLNPPHHTPLDPIPEPQQPNPTTKTTLLTFTTSLRRGLPTIPSELDLTQVQTNSSSKAAASPFSSAAMTPITSELHLDTLDESSQGEQQQGVAGAQGAGQQGSTCASLSLSRLPATGELQTGVIDTALETIAEGGVEQQGSVTLHTAGSESHTAHGQNGRTAVRRDDHISSTTDDVDENAPLLSRDESSSVTARGGSQQGGTTGRTPTKSRGGGSGAGVRHTTTTQDSALSAQSVFNSKEAAALAAAEDTPLLGAADDNSSRLRSHSAGSRLPAVLQPLPSERRFAAMGDGVSLASTSAGGSAGSEEEARSPHTPRASVAGSLERPSVSTPAQASAGARGDGRVQTMTTQDSVPQASQGGTEAAIGRVRRATEDAYGPHHHHPQHTHHHHHAPHVHHGVAATTLASRLESLMSSALIEPVVFPATEEGMSAMVRWHSFQWLLDELIEELEEAFLGISIIMGKLPCPIKS